MKNCQKCGQQMYNEAKVCHRCGHTQDAPSMGFAILGFLWPLVGLILWLVCKDATPMKAKSAGKGALVGVIVSVVLSIVFTVVYVVLIVSMMETTGSGYSYYYSYY